MPARTKGDAGQAVHTVGYFRLSARVAEAQEYEIWTIFFSPVVNAVFSQPAEHAGPINPLNSRFRRLRSSRISPNDAEDL